MTNQRTKTQNVIVKAEHDANEAFVNKPNT